MSSEPGRPHLPAPGRPVPLSTYRVQLRAEFGFADAAAVAAYLRDLGVTHLYCSPVLQAAPGSTHGYDVVDHSRLSDDLGGPAGFDALRAALGDAGLGGVVDVVPNHMAIPEPESRNLQWWDLLKYGRASAYASWFDIDWDNSATPGKVMMPVLGDTLSACLERGEITYDADGAEPVVRYFDHVVPVAPGTEALAGDLPALLDAQHYRLCHWRLSGEELDYRRFFDITTLAAVRVEDPAVFEATHRVLLDLVAEGGLDGLRVDHPDGLADPKGYLDRLAVATGGAWVVVEKILARAEALPDEWACAGTTGYEALERVGGLFVDPAGGEPLRALYQRFTGEPADFAAVVEEAKREVVATVLPAEVTRLADLLVEICRSDLALRDHTHGALHDALVEVLVAFDAYRAYVVPGMPVGEAARARVDAAVATAVARAPQREAEIRIVGELALGGGPDATSGGERERSLREQFVRRFQQTTAPVMAKGVEDTSFYRWFPLSSLNEVGGDPAGFGTPVATFHEQSLALQERWPLSMTTLTTHDTKRSEDVRARLAVLSELPGEWAGAVSGWRERAARYRSADGWPDANTEYLLWQTLVGAWPISVERLRAYLEKATREAKRHTSWTDPEEAYDTAVADFAGSVLGDAALMEAVEEFVARVGPPGRRNALAQKLVQLTMPGVPDVYQGTECESLTLVDPDNRHPVDYERRRKLLRSLDDGRLPDPEHDFDAAKLLVTSRALRLRREHPAWFGASATYEALPVTGAGAEHALAFCRSGAAVTLVQRLTVGLQLAGGWRDTAVELPGGRWHDLLGGQLHEGKALVADVLERFPVALLVREA